MDSSIEWKFRSFLVFIFSSIKSKSMDKSRRIFKQIHGLNVHLIVHYYLAVLINDDVQHKNFRQIFLEFLLKKLFLVNDFFIIPTKNFHHERIFPYGCQCWIDYFNRPPFPQSQWTPPHHFSMSLRRWFCENFRSNWIKSNHWEAGKIFCFSFLLFLFLKSF